MNTTKFQVPHRAVPGALLSLLAAAPCAAIVATTTTAHAQVIGAPGDLRWDPTFGLYHASDDGDVLNWPAGVYHMAGDSGLGHLFYMSPLDPTGPRRPRTNLTINATGVTIVITDPAAGCFFARASHGLIINGLTVTYDPLPYNQSTILAVNAANNTFDVSLDAGYLGFENPFFTYTSTPDQVNYGVLYDAGTQMLKAAANGNFLRLDGFQSLGGSNVYRLQSNPQFNSYLQKFAVGDRFAYVGRRLGRNLFDFGRCESTGAPFDRPPVTLDSCVVRAATSIAFVFRECPQLTSNRPAVVRNCTIDANDPTRLVSTNASLCFAENCRVGPLIENCVTDRVSDDGVDLHGDARTFLGYPTPGNPSIVDLDGGPRLAAGDVLQFFDPVTGQAVESAVLAIQGGGAADEDWKRVQLTVPIPLLVADTDGIEPDTSSLCWNVSTACPGSVLRNNVFRRGRGEAMLVNGRFATIEGNTLENCSQGGICLANTATPGFGQGPVPTDCLIRNNTVRNCGFWHTGEVQSAPIRIGAMKGLGFYQPASHPSCKNIVVEGNLVENWRTHGILLQAARNCQVRPFGTVFNRFKGVVASTARGLTIGAPAQDIVVDGVSTANATGLAYAMRIAAGVAASITVTRVFVKFPTTPIEDLR